MGKKMSPVIKVNAYLQAFLICSIGESKVVALIKDLNS